MSEAHWLDDSQARAWRALQRMQGPLAAALNRQLTRDSGLSMADYEVLVQLTEHPERRMRARDLGLATGWEKSRLSHHVTRMVARGLVRRRDCASDARGAYIEVTDQGLDAIRQAAPGHVAAVRELVVGRLTPEQLDQLAEIAETVYRGLGERCRAAGVEYGEADSACEADGACKSDGDCEVGGVA